MKFSASFFGPDEDFYDRQLLQDDVSSESRSIIRMTDHCPNMIKNFWMYVTPKANLQNRMLLICKIRTIIEFAEQLIP